MSDASAPIGVFDSGVGGISVLRDIQALLPYEDLIYYADSGHCPYGGKPQTAIQARASAITEFMLERQAKMVVVACNTATIAAVEHLRATYPIPFIGMEPAVKPAAQATKTGVVGVLATGAALAGEKFHRLAAAYSGQIRLITQPCPGWVEQVEQGDLEGPQTQALIRRYTQPLLEQNADVLVLGCTHYPFLRPAIQRIVGPDITLLDTGAAVARQTRRVLEKERLLSSATAPGQLHWHSSGDAQQFAAVRKLLWP